ncbi:hypothetical protein CYMTET_37381 [Cymbomonas tetramitiformis]|uniref:Transmembrane protein n=1 Tax=Cymbomonas tetramitiformis TaxID=36881 RepID=A0AAE0CE18_9CHLO|nr:hypothetical protein CYMTET_37381 [Cymbomonas tetramitiformis]
MQVSLANDSALSDGDVPTSSPSDGAPSFSLSEANAPPRRNGKRTREGKKRGPIEYGDAENRLFIIFGVLTFVALAVVLLAFYMQVKDNDDDGDASVAVWQPPRNESGVSSSVSPSSCFGATRLDEQGADRPLSPQDCEGESFIAANTCFGRPASTRVVDQLDRSITAAPSSTCADSLITESDSTIEKTALQWCLRQDPAILSNIVAFAECMCTRCDLRHLIVKYDACLTPNASRLKLSPPPSPTTRFGCAGYARDTAENDPTLMELRGTAWCALAYGPRAADEVRLKNNALVFLVGVTQYLLT